MPYHPKLNSHRAPGKTCTRALLSPPPHTCLGATSEPPLGTPPECPPHCYSGSHPKFCNSPLGLNPSPNVHGHRGRRNHHYLQPGYVPRRCPCCHCGCCCRHRSCSPATHPCPDAPTRAATSAPAPPELHLAAAAAAGHAAATIPRAALATACDDRAPAKRPDPITYNATRPPVARERWST